MNRVMNAKNAQSLPERVCDFVGVYPKPQRMIVKEREYREVYTKPESFAQFLRVRYQDHQHRVFVMDDERSCGVAFEIGHLTAQDRSEEPVRELHQRVTAIFDNIPERDKHPYVIEFFTQSFPLVQLLQDLSEYIDRCSGIEDQLSSDYKQRLQDHFDDLTADEGLFREDQYSWRGQRRKTYMLVYRSFDKREKNLDVNIREIDDLAERIENGLSAAGVRHHRLDANEYYQWLYPWFNKGTNGRSPEYHVVAHPYQEDKDIEGEPDFESDLIDWIMGADQPQSGSPAPDDGVWRWGEHYVRYVPIVGQKRRPGIGSVTISNSRTDSSDVSAMPLFYRLPENSVFTLKIVFVPQDIQEMDVSALGSTARAQTTTARTTMEVVRPTLAALAKGYKLYPVYMGFFVRDQSKEAVLHSAQSAISEINTHRFRCIDIADDLFALDEAVRALPFAYQPEFDSFLMRQYPMWLHDIVSVLPVWGQSEIQGNPCLLLFDRIGNPVIFDPLSSDRVRVAHTFLGGPTGSGKSSFLNAMLLSLIATHRPILYLIDFGGSYRYLSEYLAEMGMTVGYTKCTLRTPVAFPLFGSASKILSEVNGAFDTKSETAADFAVDDEIDALSQAVMICKIMIANGKKRAFDRITRADDAIIQEAIEGAALFRSTASDHSQIIPEDIALSLRAIANQAEDQSVGMRFSSTRQDLIGQMADAISYYTKGFYGNLFNTPAESYLRDPKDVNIIDIATLGEDPEKYNDALTLVWLGVLNHVNVLAEHNKQVAAERNILLVNDEAHITMKAELLPPVLARGAKTFRKQNIWLFLATQDLEDVPEDAKKMVSMTEYKFILQAAKDEIEKLENLIDLTDEQRRMILSCRKNPGKYTEGVLISDAYPPQIFRNVPLAIAMAMGQTETSERENRHRIQVEFGYVTENEITNHVAKELRESRRAGRSGKSS